jgi:O-antigen/teichoic acid export membrane protein
MRAPIRFYIVFFWIVFCAAGFAIDVPHMAGSALVLVGVAIAWLVVGLLVVRWHSKIFGHPPAGSLQSSRSPKAPMKRRRGKR